MPKAIFQTIYKDLKMKIEDQTYPFQQLIPSENVLVETYRCSRNTVRRAISMLVEEGYVQSMHGIGVRVIYQPVRQTSFTIGGIESFKESAIRNELKYSTKVVLFTELIADDRISEKMGFEKGAELYYIQRVRYLDNKALIFDINAFLKSAVPGLTPQIAQQSIYDYIEHTLAMSIVTSKRIMTVERVTELDEKYLELNDFNCMAVISSQTYNADGQMFEYTQSRHRPDYFSFQDTATRKGLKAL